MALTQRHQDLLDLYDVKRADWDPNDNTPRQNRDVDVIHGIELHHTGGAGPRSLSFEDKMAWGLQIESYHENNKGWTDLFYNVFVFADGEVWGGRRPDRSSQASVEPFLTVHVPGNNPAITAEQHASLLAVARWATATPANIRVHSDRAATQCPGANVRALRRVLQEELNMTTADPNLQPENLGDLADAEQAAAKGFINNDSPERVASRSVVGVVANRVDNAARSREDRLAALLAALTAQHEALVRKVDNLDQLGNVIELDEDAIDLIVAAIIIRLEE